MPKRFTLGEAQSFLPRLTGLMREAMASKTEYADAENAIRNAAARVMMMGGTLSDRPAAREARTRREAATLKLTNAIQAIEALGCVLKDLDIGLVDFPSLLDGDEVYLCWKMGEPEILFWHNLDEGFAGRKPIGGKFQEPGHGEPEQ